MLVAKAGAQEPAASPAPSPLTSPLLSPAPSASAAPKPPSAAAAATAAAMRRFDAALSDKDIETIARAIDDNRRGAARLNPRKATVLKNGDEPVTRFSAAPGAR